MRTRTRLRFGARTLAVLMIMLTGAALALWWSDRQGLLGVGPGWAQASAPADTTEATPPAPVLGIGDLARGDSEATESGDATDAEDAGGQAETASIPVRIEIPAIDVDEEIVPVGLLEDGAMEIPDFGLAGWYEPGPKPGEDGPAVVAAHVDSRAGPDVFFHLAELEPGDEIRVYDAHGTIHTFAATGSDQHSKEELPTDRIWSDEDEPALRLITCGGTFDHATGHYTDNVIVYADPV